MDQILLYGGISAAIVFGVISIFLFVKMDILHSIKVVFRVGNKFSPLNNRQKQYHTLQIREGKTTLQLQPDQETQPLNQENTVLLETGNFIILDEGLLCTGERIK